MKPAPFEYLRADTQDRVVACLAAAPDGTRVLAGGQSLVLEMNHRSARPSRLVDLNSVAGFDVLEVVRIPDGSPWLRVGPLARHRAFEKPVEAGALGRLLARTVRFIAHPPVRARGTMIGSLAYAHPTAEWPMLAVTLDAELEMAHAHGSRTLPAADFFTGPFSTARRPEELLTEVRWPLLGPGTGVAFLEHRRTAASFAQLAVAATLAVRDGTVADVRLGLAGAADRPVRAHGAESLLRGRRATPEAFADAAAAAAGEADPPPEPHASSGHRRHVADVLVRRALHQAYDDLTEPT